MIPRRLTTLLGERGSLARMLAGQGAGSAGVFVATAIVAFAMRPWMIGWLGTSTFGVWLIISSLTGYFGLADLGVRPAVVHFIARNDARGDIDEVNRYVNTAFSAFGLCGLVILAAAGIFTWLLPDIFQIPPDAVSDARIALLVVGLDLAVGLPWNAYSAVVIGKRRYDVLNRINLLMLVLRNGAIVLLLSQGGGIVALALANLGGTVLEMALKSGAAFRLEPRLRFRLGLANREAAKDLLRYGMMAVVVTLSLQLVWLTDAMVIGWLIAVPAVTAFSNGAVLPSQIRQLLAAAGRVIEPAAGALDARDDHRALGRIMRGGARTMIALAAPMLVYLLVFGEMFLLRWLGPEEVEKSALVMTVLAFGVAAPIASYPFVAVMYGANQVRALAGLSLLEGIANLAISISLAGPLGIVGVAIGTAVPAAVVHLVLMPRVVLRRYGVPWGDFMLHAWARPLAAAGVTWVVLSAVPLGTDAPGWALLVGLAAGTAALFGVVWFALGRFLPFLDGAVEPKEDAA
ncbi:MAG: oligosaccharide flippase family protein [Planctomycetota bacterium]|nr:oligosaccharide flippase family protein [Planctomycetota bacterium]